MTSASTVTVIQRYLFMRHFRQPFLFILKYVTSVCFFARFLNLFPQMHCDRLTVMTLCEPLQTHLGKVFIVFFFVVVLSFYHLYNTRSKTLHPVTDGDVSCSGLLGLPSGQKYPIENLFEDARQKQAHLVERQSKSLAEALINYKDRYNREPPPGFDKWYHAAISLNASIIDDYDSVMASFEPYWSISARELRARVREVLDPKLIEGKLIGIRVKNHQFYTVNRETGMNRK